MVCFCSVAPTVTDDPGRHANGCGIFWNVPDDQGIGSDARAIADCYRPEYLGTGADIDIVTDNRRTLPIGISANSNILLNTASVADYGTRMDADIAGVDEMQISANAGFAIEADAAGDENQEGVEPIELHQEITQEPVGNAACPGPISVVEHGPQGWIENG